MHASTIAITLAMAGSSMAAILPNSPTATSTSTVINTEIRPYGPTCASFGLPGSCAGLTPEERVVPDDGDKGDPDYPGRKDFDDLTEHEKAIVRKVFTERIKEMFGEPLNEANEETVKKPVEGVVRVPAPSVTDPIRVGNSIVRVPVKEPTKEPVEEVIHVASSIVRVPVTPTTSTDSEPFSVSIAASTATCSSCTHPRKHSPDWDKHAVLNDTRKNYKGFKLFADLGMTIPPFAAHVREHEGRKDIWDIRLFPSVNATAPLQADEKKESAKTPSNIKFLEEAEKLNAHQPRWNLADNRLESRSADSAPVNDTLYFRLFESKAVKDTSQFHGSVYRSMLTTNDNKSKYHKEANAKLVAKKAWQLVREKKPDYEYVLTNKDIKGSFFWCIDQEKMAALKAADAKLKTLQSSGEQIEGSDLIEMMKGLGGDGHQELMYSDSKEATIKSGSADQTCMAVTLKAEQFLDM